MFSEINYCQVLVLDVVVGLLGSDTALCRPSVFARLELVGFLRQVAQDPERKLDGMPLAPGRHVKNSTQSRWLGARKRLKRCTSRIGLPLQDRKGTHHTPR